MDRRPPNWQQRVGFWLIMLLVGLPVLLYAAGWLLRLMDELA